MAKAVDLTGKKFRRLTVIFRVGSDCHRSPTWSCLCDCGNTTIVSSRHLVDKNGTGSCGCIRNEAKSTHGQRLSKNKRTKEYKTWTSIKQRCYNPKHIGYKNYGGRGIQVCDRWLNSFENFFADMGKAPSSKHSIDRFPNNDGNYEPSNCRWATAKEQNNNTRKTKLKSA